MYNLINVCITIHNYFFYYVLQMYFFGYTLIYVLIHSIFFYDRLTMNIKRPNPIKKVLSFEITKQLTKPRKREDEKNEDLNCNPSFTEFNSSLSYSQFYM